MPPKSSILLLLITVFLIAGCGGQTKVEKNISPQHPFVIDLCGTDIFRVGIKKSDFENKFQSFRDTTIFNGYGDLWVSIIYWNNEDIGRIEWDTTTKLSTILLFYRSVVQLSSGGGVGTTIDSLEKIYGKLEYGYGDEGPSCWNDNTKCTAYRMITCAFLSRISRVAHNKRQHDLQINKSLAQYFVH